MSNGKLTNIEKGDSSGFRTEANGKRVLFEHFPRVGKPFIAMGEGVVAGNRLIMTSDVVSVISRTEKIIEFQTESGSLYQLEIE